MKTTLGHEELQDVLARLHTDLKRIDPAPVDDIHSRMPVHVVYGGAHLFTAETPAKLGKIALRTLRENVENAGDLSEIFGIPSDICVPVYDKITEKLTREPVEDLRIDFEDGYGFRSDEEEDGHAESTALEVAKGLVNGTLPPSIGIRIKSLSRESGARAIRTLDLFLTSLIRQANGGLPQNFVVTLPKITTPEQVGALVSVFDEIEPRLGLPAGVLKLEMMVETPQSLVSDNGHFALPNLLAASQGRCVAVHFGAYDYAASLGITAESQDMLSKSSDLARGIMQLSLAGTDVRISDGATNIMPVAKHRGDDLTSVQKEENRETIRRAWRLHFDHCRNSLGNGIYQGWDLHPAQLVSRYAAVYSFFLEGLDAAGQRLRNFVGKAAQATLVGDVFDDAATGQGLLNYFVQALECGALNEAEATLHSGLSIEELRSGSFKEILIKRR